MTDKFTISLPVFDTCLSSNGLREVTKSSSLDEKEALEIMARYFKSEMHFDNVQYDAKKHDENTIGFMFIENAMDVCTDEHDQMPTKRLRRIHNAWHSQFASALMFTAQWFRLGGSVVHHLIWR
ncbi:hypothetical protein IHC87_05565 [Photobacterium damselae subsp. damselae]|uniref:hypothetical protein n=1 Tax=Photobacterium damselae TaxID=38293 RepID=UPI001F2D73C7|nr:hypothetical protein [Photobacterium damselae]UJZ94837.1 hypothetical protein IHC87_05565 [Photobacterium damselae subsp. damselae]UJZ98821.1 hypothetical protein IHC88_05570 [Photobacterium damselae subsp. damselae]